MTDIKTDWRKAKYEALLSAGVHAINRARFVFIVLNVTGVFILIGLYNSTFTWLRHAITRARAMSPPPDHLAHLQKTAYEELWTMTAPLIGVKISVFDLAIIGSGALFVLAVWQYYCNRRENSVTHRITAEAQKSYAAGEIEAAEYLYHGIAHYFVFTTRHESFVPAGTRPRVAPTRVVQSLAMMPAWIPLFIVLSEVASVAFPYDLALNPAVPLWTIFSNSEKVEECIRVFIALTLGFWSLVLCVYALRFDRATRESIEPLMAALEK